MSEQDRKDGVKRLVESHPGIFYTELLERVKKDMAKPTATKIIKQLLDGGEIISRKDGKKKRYHPAEPDQKNLEKDFSGNMKRLRRVLEKSEDDFTSYPYEVQIWLNRDILDKLDEFGPKIKKYLEMHEHYYSVDSLVDDYGRRCTEISKLKSSMRNDLTHMVMGYINDTNSVGLLHHVASKASELRRKQKSLKSGQERDNMSKRIKCLDSIVDMLFRYTDEILVKLQELQKVRKQGSLQVKYGERELVHAIRYVEERRRDFQTTVQNLQKRIAELNGRKIGGDQVMRLEEPDLTDVIKQIESIKMNLDEVGKMLEKWYHSTFADRLEQDMYTKIRKAEEYVKHVKITLQRT